jgi:hypothetical protein
VGYDISHFDNAPRHDLGGLPTPVDLGNGWWRRIWTVRTDPPDPPVGLLVPPPFDRLIGAPTIISIVAAEPGIILVYQFTHKKKSIDGEVGYLSLVMQLISKLYTRITVDGYTHHWILRVATLDETMDGTSQS